MKTIAKNHIAKHLTKISNIKCHSFSNGFSGTSGIEIDGHCFKYALKNGKTRVDVAARKGSTDVHSNLWYTFDYAA